MTLVDYIKQGAARTKTSFSRDKGKFADYLMTHELKNYFSDDVPEDQRVKLKGELEARIDTAMAKYDKELHGFARKAGSKGTMGLAVANDIYAYVSNVPIANVTGLGYALFAIKTAVELPAMYRYLKKSHDWYGALKHNLLKPARYLLPVFGAALESGAFERMVRKTVMKEAKHSFIKDFGDYVGFEDQIKNKLKQPLKVALGPPEKIAA